MAVSYIGMDVDCKMSELAVRRGGKLVTQLRVETTIPALREALQTIPKPRHLAIEEGSLTHWLVRNLDGAVDRLVACDPRRNAYIAKDGEKYDPLDAEKLSELLEGGFLREVYHSTDDNRVLFKRMVSHYHDRVINATRHVNKMRAFCLQYGLRPPKGALRDPRVRDQWLQELPNRSLAELLGLRWQSMDIARQDSVLARGLIQEHAKGYSIIRCWQSVPGVGPIRAMTLFAYLDTPHRFANRSKLYKYCGAGLERRSSGSDRQGRPKKGRLRLCRNVNRRLKNVVFGATLSAIRQGGNIFGEDYERMVAKGMRPCNARHAVARKILRVMMGMWKTERKFDPTLLKA